MEKRTHFPIRVFKRVRKEVGQDFPLLYRFGADEGSAGLLPKDMAMKIEQFKVTRHQISRMILRMNKRFKKEFGEHVAEQRGWN